MLEAPSAPESLKEAGLTLAFLNDMILKARLYPRRHDRPRPGSVSVPAVQSDSRTIKFLKDEKHIEVMGGDLVGEVSYRFSLTDVGRKRAQEAMQIVRLCRPCSRADRRLCRTMLSPGRHRHCVARPKACRRPFRTWC